MTPRSLRIGGLAGQVGGLLAFLLVPLYPLSVLMIWKDTLDDPYVVSAHLASFRAALGPLLAFGTPSQVTRVYGCAIGPVHLLFFVCLLTLLRAQGPALGKLGRIGLYVALLGHAGEVWANLFDYWRITGVIGLLHETSWVVTILAGVVQLSGWLLLGIAVLRSPTFRKAQGLLILWGSACTLGLYTSYTVVGFNPEPTFIAVGIGIVTLWLAGGASMAWIGRDLWNQARTATSTAPSENGERATRDTRSPAAS